MYTKPNDPNLQLAHWRQVIEATKDDPSMLAFYAYTGAREQAQMARTYLINKQDSSTKTLSWIAEIGAILELKRAE